MRRETCLFIILVNLFCIYAQCPWTASGVKYWSNPATWPGNVVPYSGTVTIPSGTTVVYDITVSGNLFTGIVVPSGSKLVFDGTKDVILETNYVHVQFNGAFLIGTESCPFPKKATITLTGPKDTTTSISGMGNKAIINAGTLEFFGVPPKPTWTRVAATVNVNATSFTVQDTLTNWKAGETIFLATTDYYQELSERLQIVSVSGKTVTVDRPINYLHYGANNQFAEVGYMTRNILIQGDSLYSDLSSYGGHVINFGNASGRIYGVEFNRMGQRGIIGRYPFHYHVMLEQTGKGHYVNESSFHDTYQRCLTVHGTSGISVQNNVAFNITGHCYFLEEGSETNNYYNHNLGAWINPSTMIPTDNKPSVFWITNPNNTFINNAAVGGTFGFWFSMPARPLGLTAYQTWIYPRFTPLGKFENNVAHSAQSNGVHCDGGPNASGVEENFGYSPLVPPHTSSTQTYNTEEVRAFFTNTNAYKNRGYGMWMKGNYLTVENSLLQDNSAGVNTPGSNNLVQYTTIVGETDNIGTPGFTKYFNDFGRSRPRLWAADWRIRGWEAYDNGCGQFARNLTFVNFTSNSIRDAGALSALPSGPFNNPPTDILTETTMKNSNIFVINSYGGDNDGPKHVVLQDADGSITGSYGSFVTSNNTILLYNHNCTKKVEWNGFYHCQSSEHGFSNIEVRNTNTGGSDFGDSLTKAVRATWVPFGQSSIKNTIQGGSVDGKIRTAYTSNVISRKGYVLQFPHPTPPQLQVNLRYAATGEWIVLALSYPATATFTITRGYSKIPLTNVTSLSGLSSSTYFFDKNTQYLYVMYFEDNGKVEGPMGFPMYGYGESYVDITASCGNQCQPTIVQSIPATYNPGEDNYRAKLQGCVAGTSSSNEGKAFFNYNSKTKRVTYIIYHNIPRATTAKITGSKGTVFEFPVAQSPIRGGFSISWDKHNDLWNGNWTIKIESANPSQAIGGKIGCFGTCSVPPSISSWNPCTKINKEHVLSGDGLNTTLGWADWSYGSNRSFVYTADKLCETTATWVNFYPWSSLTMHMGIGDCAPGSCSASWQKPYLNISSFSHFQFAARSPTGPLINVPLSIRAADHKGTYLSSFKQVSFNYISNYVIEDSWTRIKIPLADLGFKGNELVGIFSIAMNGGSGATPVLFDEIKLVPNFSDPNNRAPSGVVKNYSETC